MDTKPNSGNNQGVGEKIALLRGLRQIRQFRPDALPDAAMQDILEVARWSGSASNSQPWEFLVIRDRATLQQVAAISPNLRHIANAGAAIVLVMQGDREPALISYDEGRLTERIMLAAAAHELGAGIGWLTLNPEGADLAKQMLGIPIDRWVRTVIALGYPADEAKQMRTAPGQARKPLSELVHEERF